MSKSLVATAELVARYQSGEPWALLVAAAGVSRIALYKRLRRVGVPLTRTAAPRWYKCSQCGKRYRRQRRAADKAIARLCSMACYVAKMHSDGAGYNQWRHGQRIGRRVVAAVYALQPGNVVHHHDRDNRNNAIGNLAVFATNSDHISFHKGGSGRTIWDGRKYRAST
jgi:hypothetical protein